MLTSTTLHLSDIVPLTHEMRSDHATIVCTVAAGIDTRETSTMYNFSKADCIRYKICVNNKIMPNAEFETTNDIELGLERIRTAMHDAKEVAVPLVRKHNQFLRISQHIKFAIAELNKLNRQWQRCPGPRSPRETQLKNNINAANRSIAAQVNYERNLQWADTMLKLRTGSKKFWHLSKTIRGKKPGAVGELLVEDELKFTNSDKANALTKAFETERKKGVQQYSRFGFDSEF